MGASGSVLLNSVGEIKLFEEAPAKLRSKIIHVVEAFLTDVVAEDGESDLAVTIYRAHGLTNRDSRSKSDPFVVVSLDRDPDTYKTTSRVKNDLNPSWGAAGETLVLKSVSGRDELVIEVFDSDEKQGANPRGRKDDFVGEIRVEMDDDSFAWGKQTTRDLFLPDDPVNSQGTLTFSYERSVALPDADEDTSVKDWVMSIFEVIPEDRKVRSNCFEAMKGFVDVTMELGGDVLKQVDGHPSLLHRFYDAAQNSSVDSLLESLRKPKQVQEKAETVKKPVLPFEEPVVRKEIRRMSTEEQQRFVNAIKKTMESDTQGGSEWLRIAGYHGWPSNNGRGYCTHRAESFPGWHRAYLLELERALQMADIALGNDGRIGVPYWDFSTYEVNGEVVPRIIRENFTKGFQFPENFFPADGPKNKDLPDFQEKLFGKIRSDRKILRKLRKGKIHMSAKKCLDIYTNSEHWQHASTENKGGNPSVEDSHNKAHNYLGFPLTKLHFAAFHPMFWLLHCNTDRIYEKYMQMKGAEVCHAECINHQKIVHETFDEDGNQLTNLYEKPLAPFACPYTYQNEPDQRESFAFPHSFIDCAELGFVYDRLPPRPKQMLQEMPNYCLFAGVDVGNKLRDNRGVMKSFDVHVYIARKGNDMDVLRTELVELVKKQSEDLEDHPNHAGLCSLFGGKGEGCANCRENKKINAMVSLNDAMASLGIDSRFELDCHVILEDEFGELVFLSDVNQKYGPGIEIPDPVVVGPFFEQACPDMSTETVRSDENANKQNILQPQTTLVQDRLARMGFYVGSVDGDLGPKTDEAIKRFQEFSGLKSDGLIGPLTKAVMTQPRYDKKGDVSTAASEELRFTVGQEIKYWVGTHPGYLQRQDVLREFQMALNEWASVGLFTFKLVENRADADITLRWSDHTVGNDSVFDGPGGEIARADDKGVTFDTMEKWSCSPKIPKRRGFRLRTVALHELGHVLGLHHSGNPKEVMSPYYVATRFQLTPSDKENLKNLYQK